MDVPGPYRPGSRAERKPQKEIGNYASSYVNVCQDKVDPQVDGKDGRGVLDVRQRTEVEVIKLLNTSRDNRIRSHDH